MTDIESRTLGDICDEVQGTIRTGPFGSQLHESDYCQEGHPVVMPKNILDGRVSTDEIAHIGDQDAVRLDQHRLKKGDIVYGRRGDIGRRALITEREAGWLCGTGCLRISLGDSVLDPTFLYYFLGQPKVTSWIYNQAVGATMPNLNTGIIRSVRVSYPPLPTQRKIAAILSAYDDLIENNTRRIKILEEMAQALYREWFVHFRFPGHARARLPNSPLGELAENWEFRRLDESCSAVLDGDWIETKDQGGEDYRLLQISNIGLGDFVETGNFRYVTQETFDRLRCTEIRPDDLLIARMPTPIGRGWLARKMPWRMITAVDVAIARPDCHRISPVFLLHFWNQPSTLAVIEKQSSGTTRLRITRRELCAMRIPTPPLFLQEQFAAKARPMLDFANILRDKNAILRRTRDLLLPKLVSGEIDVSNLDKP